MKERRKTSRGYWFRSIPSLRLSPVDKEIKEAAEQLTLCQGRSAALGDSNTSKRTAALPQEETVARRSTFTRIPKIQSLIDQGVPAEAIPTYCCLADYSNNKTGLCWPKMETIAATLNRSVRTIQRHVHLLASLGLIELLERRRHKGRFSSYLYKIIHITRTTGHGRRVAAPVLYTKRTKSSLNSRKQAFNIQIDPKDEEARRKANERRRRTEDYEWLFK
jgi:hypothetical protein